MKTRDLIEYEFGKLVTREVRRLVAKEVPPRIAFAMVVGEHGDDLYEEAIELVIQRLRKDASPLSRRAV